MAGLGGKNWTFQEEVTSSDVNGFLADQVVMRFADSTARTAGFGGSGEPTLAEGMVSYLDDANRVDYYNGSAWKPVSQVLQVVSTTKTDTFTTTSTTFTDITGATATITPSSTSNKILVMGFTFLSGQSGTTSAFVRLARGGTGILIGDAAGSRVQATSSTLATHGRPSFHILDSPATTSATTYSIQVRAGTAGTVYVNRTQGDADAVNDSGRFATTITVMEIAG